MKVSARTRVKLKWVFHFFALIGLSVQTIIISVEFFHFFVERDAEFVIPKKLWIPDLTLCMKIWDMVPEKKAMKVSQVLIYTVDVEDLVSSQLVRLGNKHCLMVNNTISVTGCDGSMIITKGLISDNVCYTLSYNFTHGNGQTRETISNTNHLTDDLKNTFYTVILAEQLRNMSSFIPVVHSPRQSPTNSYDLSEFHPRGVKEGKFVFRAYQVSYKSYTIQLLPSPYETRCKKYAKSQAECKEKCTSNYYLENTAECPEDVFITNFTVFGDRTLTSGLDFAKKRIKSCTRRCRQEDCSLKYSTSRVRGVNTRFQNADGVIISLIAPLDPQVEVKSKPAFPTFEYILYIASCLGIWFGVSFLSLNPVPVEEPWSAPQKFRSPKMVIPTEEHKMCRQELRIVRRQNAVLFMKVNSIERTLGDILNCL